jgi:N4-gp56 family major capsid protein
MTTLNYADNGLSPRTNAYAAVEMLAHAEPTVVLQKFGMTKPLPQNKTDTIKFRRVVPLAALSAPLVEGVTPTGQRLNYQDVTVQMKQWGGFIEISDVIQDTHEDPVLQNSSQQCGEQATRTVEAVTWGILRAGTSVFYANGASRSAVNTPISLNKQRAVTRSLKAQKAQKITSILSGSVNYQTKPIEAAYVAIAHTDLESDIRGLAGFTPVAEYGSRQMLCPEEIGSVEDVRYILSADLTNFPDAGGAKGSMVSTSGTAADVYPILYLGKEAYGLVPLKGKGAITPMINNPGRAQTGDPLGQRGSVGWKAYFNAVRLNENYMHRLEVAATAL